MIIVNYRAACLVASVASSEHELEEGSSTFSLILKLDQYLRQIEKAERAVNANQRRRAPNPGGTVHKKRNLLRRPMKRSPVHRGRHDQPITKPIMTASQIGTAHSKISTNVSVIEGFFINSITSNK